MMSDLKDQKKSLPERKEKIRRGKIRTKKFGREEKEKIPCVPPRKMLTSSPHLNISHARIDEVCEVIQVVPFEMLPEIEVSPIPSLQCHRVNVMVFPHISQLGVGLGCRLKTVWICVFNRAVTSWKRTECTFMEYVLTCER